MVKQISGYRSFKVLIFYSKLFINTKVYIVFLFINVLKQCTAFTGRIRILRKSLLVFVSTVKQPVDCRFRTLHDPITVH
jgi:hypothetical protein